MDTEKENLFKGRFNKKVRVEGTTDWSHDPSGEELEIIDDEKYRIELCSFIVTGLFSKYSLWSLLFIISHHLSAYFVI